MTHRHVIHRPPPPSILEENSTARRRKKDVFALFTWLIIGTAFMDLADQYKRRAAECIRMAERTDHAEDKALFLQMAQTWMRLAEKVEDGRDEK
jgi:hypothetical protein